MVPHTRLPLLFLCQSYHAKNQSETKLLPLELLQLNLDALKTLRTGLTTSVRPLCY
jgi:hypothetical protein